ncbi:MAG: hypothetical protein RUMPE_00185 [Eubacteriales bacterium SKADARSKE-1]|nr:hypothetical protein [Eubacteriales bacterium SKADARSKE-1]
MNAEGGFGLMNFAIMAVFIVGMYFLLIRPNSKRKKQEESMRNSLKPGDEITTIGGIVGKIVSVKDDNDSFIIETGIDRNKLKIKKWAIASCDITKETSEK